MAFWLFISLLRMLGIRNAAKVMQYHQGAMRKLATKEQSPPPGWCAMDSSMLSHSIALNLGQQLQHRVAPDVCRPLKTIKGFMLDRNIWVCLGSNLDKIRLVASLWFWSIREKTLTRRNLLLKVNRVGRSLASSCSTAQPSCLLHGSASCLNKALLEGLSGKGTSGRHLKTPRACQCEPHSDHRSPCRS